ncbi:MAG: alternative ribosome rescue aminoacyl-tRNA hydrolase ArfB [Bacteroidota bacterium]
MNWNDIRKELDFRTSRASGAGGQHVNKAESRVELVFNVRESNALTARERERIAHHLAKRMDGLGRISVVDQSDRSQHTNRKRAEARLYQLLEQGTRPIPKKHVGKAFVANKKKRLDRKKRRGEVKAARRKNWM